MENFEKSIVAMLGRPCSQHVTGNTSRQNQLQSAIIVNRRECHWWLTGIPDCLMVVSPPIPTLSFEMPVNQYEILSFNIYHFNI